MGQALNKMISLTGREIKSYNLERRAEKVISRDKPIPAPIHPSAIKELERLKEENVSTEYLHKKDEQLDTFLKKVYVTSPDTPPPLERKINPDRPLPVNRHTEWGINYGYSDSEEAVVPEGKASLKQALGFISNHQNDPKKYSNVAIASQYKLSLEDTNDILEHFKMLAVKIQKKEVDPASLSAYERLQLRVKEMTIYNAPAIMNEVKVMFGDKKEMSDEKEKGEKSVVTRRQDENNQHRDRNAEENEEKINSKSAVEIEKTENKKDLKTEEHVQNVHEKRSFKPEEDIKNGLTKKRSQENG